MRRVGAGSLSIALVFATTGVLAGCKKAEEPAPTVHRVGISGTALPLITDPDPVEVMRSDSVTWSHATADSIIVFLDDEYADPAQVRAARGEAATTAIKRDAPYRRFKYSVGVFAGDSSAIQDPEIIVKPRG